MNILLPKLFLSFLVCFCFLFTTGCSKQEQDKFKEELKELFMTDAERMKKQRFQVIDENAKSKILKNIIQRYEAGGKSYQSIDIFWVKIRDNHGYSSAYWESQGYPKGYIADYSVRIISGDFATKTTIRIEGEIGFWFKNDKNQELHYMTDFSDWRVVDKTTESTGNVEKAIGVIGNLFK